MASCAECVHIEVCRYYTNELAKANGIPLKLEEVERLLECDDCENFKDRSRFVELPKALHFCDEVHFVLRDLDEIDLKEYSFTVGSSAVSDTVQFITEIGTHGFWVGESPREFAPDYDDFFHWYELGKTVFLTREEAEQALKGRENNG